MTPLRLALPALLFLAASAARAEPASIDRQIEDIVTRYTETKLGARGPGAAVMVLRDGKPVFQQGFGLANLKTGDRITSTTLFDLASCSKQFTATAVMILADRGKLAFDDDVRKYLPELPEYNKDRPIRLADLLHHTSGLKEYLDFIDVCKRDPDLPTNADVLREFVKRKKLAFPTGTKHKYTNTNYMLLALVVERVAKKPFSKFMKEEVFDPAGMKDTLIFDDDKLAPNRARGYTEDKAGKVHQAGGVNVVTGDGNVMSNLDDLAKWEVALREHRLVEAGTLKKAWTAGTLDDGTAFAYGFGWEVSKRNGRRALEHTGAWDGFSDYVLRYPDDGLAVVVLCNVECDQAAVGRKVAALYLGKKKD